MAYSINFVNSANVLHFSSNPYNGHRTCSHITHSHGRSRETCTIPVSKQCCLTSFHAKHYKRQVTTLFRSVSGISLFCTLLSHYCTLLSDRWVGYHYFVHCSVAVRLLYIAVTSVSGISLFFTLLSRCQIIVHCCQISEWDIIILYTALSLSDYCTLLSDRWVGYHYCTLLSDPWVGYH